MKVGLILDNLFQPADSSFQKLRLMNAGVVGTLFTQGTKHRRWIFDECERRLDRPTYLIRIDGYDDTPDGWLTAARDALAEVPENVLLEGRVVTTCKNEPNIEHYVDDPVAYGQLYAAVTSFSVPVLFACPSLGIDGWSQWLSKALDAVGHKPRYAAINLYGPNVGRIGDFIGMFEQIYITEVNSAPEVQGQPRIDFLRRAFGTLSRAGVKAALVFIAGGQSHGSWDERYIISEDEARGLAGWEGEITMPKAAIAVLPANQDKNVSKWIPAYNEHGAMHWLSPHVKTALIGAGFNAEWFGAEPQSADTYHLENLIKQVKEANDWLDGQPEPVKFLVSMHTDSGDFSHTFGIFGSTREAESAKIASAIGEQVHEALGTAEFRSFDKLGTKDYNSYVFYSLSRYSSVLIELCSHENRRDIEALWAKSGDVASAIARGVQAYVGGSGAVDWKAEAETYREKNRALTASYEAVMARLANIKDYVART